MQPNVDETTLVVESMPMKRGIFVSFEGNEGCGKSTQIGLLEHACVQLGRTVVRVREPGGTALGEEVRHLLKHSPAGEGMCPEAEILLFGASRAELVRKVIVPALAADCVVLADRFVDSTTVYQGLGRGLPLDSVHGINALATGGLLPDLTVLLDIDVAGSRARTASRGLGDDRFEREADAFFEKVRAGYLTLAAQAPERFLVLDAVQEPATIHQAILGHLSARFHGLHT